MAEEVKLKVVIDGVEKNVSTINELNEALVQTRAELRNVAVGSEDFEQLQRQFSVIDSQLRDIQTRTKGIKIDELSATFLKFGETVTSSFALATTSLSLFGAESEDVARAQLKAQQLLTIVITAKNLAEIIEGETAAARLLIGKAQIVQTTLLTGLFGKNTVATAAQAVATGNATAAQIALNAAMNANPILIVAVAIGALVAALAFFSNSEIEAAENIDFTNQRLQEQQEEIRRTASAAIELARIRGQLTELEATNEQARLQVNRETQKEILRIQQEELENLKKNEQSKIDAILETTDFVIFQARQLKAAQDQNAPGLNLTPLQNDLISLLNQLETGVLTQEQFYARSLDIQVRYAEQSNDENAKALNERRVQFNSLLTSVQGYNNQLALIQDKNALIDAQYNKKIIEQNNERQKRIIEANNAVIKSTEKLNTETIQRSQELTFALRESLARQGKAYEDNESALRDINARKLQGETAISLELNKIAEERANFQLEIEKKARQKDIEDSKASDKVKATELEKLNKIFDDRRINTSTEFAQKRQEIEANAKKQLELINEKLAEEISFGDFNIYDNKERLRREDEAQDIQFQLNQIERNQSTKGILIDLENKSSEELFAEREKLAKIEAQQATTTTDFRFLKTRELIRKELELRKEQSKLNLQNELSEIDAAAQLRIVDQTKLLKDVNASTEEIEAAKKAIEERAEVDKRQAVKANIDELAAYEVDATRKTQAAKAALAQEYIRTLNAGITSAFQFAQAENEKELFQTRKKYDDQFIFAQDAIQKELNAEIEAANRSVATEQEKAAKRQEAVDKANKKKQESDKKTNEELLKEENKLREKQFKAEKNLNIAKAVINGAQAITSILAQYPKFDGGFAMAAAIAASVVTTAAQVAVISSQQYSPDGFGQAKDLQVPDLSTADPAQQSGINQGGFTLFNPENVNLTQTGTRNTDGGAPLGPLRVIVVESDITDTQNRVRAIVEQASFG